jgi:hypothetical protein
VLGSGEDEANIAELYGGWTVMVWESISWDGRTDLVVPNRGTSTGQRYIYDTLDNQVMLYAGAVGDQFIVIDDNARPHRVRVVQDYLERESIECMNSPPRSPDLNPIEHMWNELQVRISARLLQPRTTQELGAMLVQKWAVIPVIFRTTRNIIGSL